MKKISVYLNKSANFDVDYYLDKIHAISKELLKFYYNKKLNNVIIEICKNLEKSFAEPVKEEPDVTKIAKEMKEIDKIDEFNADISKPDFKIIEDEKRAKQFEGIIIEKPKIEDAVKVKLLDAVKNREKLHIEKIKNSIQRAYNQNTRDIDLLETRLNGLIKILKSS